MTAAPLSCEGLPVTNLIAICVIVLCMSGVACWFLYLMSKDSEK